MKKWVVALSLLAAPAAAGQRLEDALLVSAAVADLATTEVGLAAGARELNPLGQTRAGRVAVKAACTAAMLLATRKLRRDGHERAARVVSTLAIAASFGAAGWNLGVVVRLR